MVITYGYNLARISQNLLKGTKQFEIKELEGNNHSLK